ncbi:MAG TPA: ankyrin repeat domain-containing protein [Vicinamibacterales bacterium]|nr:ankyrin repeat domain-containing protein [Vicinamibacterales bacterium]
MLRRLLSGACLGLAGALCATALVVAAPANAPVADAVMNGNLAEAKALLTQGADVNAAQNDGMTALHWAALNGDRATAKMLLYAGADPNAATRIGAYTPLDIAAKDGHARLVEALLKGGANPKLTDVHGTTPLMLASASGSVQAVTDLLASGADVNAKEHVKGETALMFAAAAGRANVVPVLMAHGADWRPTTKILDWTKLKPNDPRLPSFKGFGFGKPGKKKMPAGAKAVKTAFKGKKGVKPVAAVAKEKGVPPTAGVPAKKPGFGGNPFLSYYKQVGTQGGLTALLFAVRQGDVATVQALLKGGADINQVDPGDHTSPLMMAVVNGHFDLADTLVKDGANPNLAQVSGAAPLFAVLNCVWADKALYPQPTAYKEQKLGYLALMKDLLAHGANPNARLNEQVWYSAYNFDQEGLDQTGATPFWRAAYGDDINAMKLLVAHGANPHIPTRKPKAMGLSAFYHTKTKKDYSGLPPIPVGGPDITPLLAASGEGYGWSLTANHHRYAPTGMLKAVKYLVEDLHANVNARDADGNTPLDNAAAVGNNGMILYLVSKGADIHAINRNGQTVADMANGPVQRVNPFPKTIALVEKLGGKLMHKCVSCGG